MFPRNNLLVDATWIIYNSSIVQVGTLPHFLIIERALLPIGLCLILFKATTSSLVPNLCCSIILTSLTWRLLWFIILLSRRKCRSFQPRGQLNHQMVVLVCIPMCLWSLSIWLVYVIFLILSDLISTLTCLLLGCLLLNRFGNLFNRVIMLSSLILRMLAYMFLLSSIIKFFCDLFARINHISVILCNLGLLQHLGYLLPLLNPYLSLCHHRDFHIIIYLDDILICSKSASKRAWCFMSSPLVHLKLQINFSKSELSFNHHFFEFVLGYIVCVSLPSGTYMRYGSWYILCCRHSMTVHWVMSFLGKANFCVCGYSSLWW